MAILNETSEGKPYVPAEMRGIANDWAFASLQQRNALAYVARKTSLSPSSPPCQIGPTA